MNHNPKQTPQTATPEALQGWSISLENLTVGYGDNVVLKNISDVLPAGQISVILGGSGCGKSTLLRHILGLNRPLSGVLRLGEHDLSKLSRREINRVRRRMGMLFQDGALLGSLTLGQNVALPLVELTRMPQQMISEVVQYKLSLVGLEDFTDYFPNQLSGGMRKRAGLARALVMDPPILLCDEPTSGLDPINAAQMDELLLSLKHEFPDTTIVVVSHDLTSTKGIADHILMLYNKGIVFSGSRNELESCNDIYVRQFMDRKATGHALGINSLSDKVRAELNRWMEN
jgi:phospholipid/cholesterol/gamma-HCH transport system ATP-binding protein